MASCSVCFGTYKIKVGNDLYWCSKCTPKDHAGLLTDEVEELVARKFVPASSKMKFYKQPSQTMVMHSAEGITASFTLEPEVVEEPQTPTELKRCASCGDESSMIIVKTVESWELYHFTTEYIDGNWTVWAEFQNAEPGDTIKDSQLECTNCGYLSSIPESFTLEYS